MRLLADECCPAPVVEALRRSGHDVLYVLETMAGAADLAIVARARGEQRVILTEDYDFAELAIRQNLDMPGLVVLAFANEPMHLRVTRTVAVVERHGSDLGGHVTIAGPRRERRRPLTGP